MLFIAFGFSNLSERECDSIKWKEFHVIGSEETAGNVMLSVGENGEIFNKLNTVILSTSEYLLDDNSSNEVLSESVIRSRFSEDSSGRVYAYESSIIIPYQFLKPFLNTKSRIFNTLKQLSDNE